MKPRDLIENEDARDALIDDATHAAEDAFAQRGLVLTEDQMVGLNDYLAALLRDVLPVVTSEIDDNPDHADYTGMQAQVEAARQGRSAPALNTYLIAYGADNELWLCKADDVSHAVEQFEDDEPREDINHILVCTEVEIPPAPRDGAAGLDAYLRRHQEKNAGRGMWETHSCSRCDDGRRPDRCPSREGVCEYPHAVND